MLFRSHKMPTIGKILIVQIGGRVVRAAAILLAVFAFGNESIKIATIWLSISTGIFGLALQWSFLPLIVYRVENLKKHEN